jgi:hypothetical protein
MVKIREGLAKAEARTCERALITTIGRADKGEGPLLNQAEGVGAEPMTNEQRAALFHKKMTARGLGQVTLWVPMLAVADFKNMARAMVEAPHLILALEDLRTGQVKGLK